VSLPSGFRDLYASAPDGQRIREGVTFSHPGFTRQFHLTPDSVRFAADDGSGATIIYDPGPVQVLPPDAGEGGAGTRPIRIVALPEVAQALVAAAKRSVDPLRVTVRQYLGASLVPGVVVRLELGSVQADMATGIISGSAGFADLEGRFVPRVFARPETHPGLVRR
jgi:hypothetical protein